MSYLKLSGISKSYGQFNALEAVDLDIAKGEFVTFLGPSGSGKTTTLMIIAGFESATSGQVEIENRSLFGLAPHQRNIGIVFQNYGLFPHKTAAQNVYFPLQMRGVKKAPGLRKAEEMLELVGLKDFGHRHPKELSGGQQQRVALARALVFEPSLLLLDEPLGALDKNLREQMQIEIKRIQRALGVTTIFVTHDQSEAMSMSDRIVVFEKGHIQQVASPLELYHRPQTRFVAGFIGESNLIDVKITDAAKGEARNGAIGPIDYAVSDRASTGSEATLMIRPEHIKLSRNPVGGRQNVRMKVETIVNYGDNALVVGKVGDHTMRVRVLGADVVIIQENEECCISWQRDSVYLIAK
ncbi:putative spermidine/putrescine transport system ATP-binding protein [Pseudaminobacter salicylatoxidans]|uniref:Putative spermidine/putrescine transport system ATP-binding protein n=1 Tax=Pseudaminobacter salicylatoxidans TaxID=93369 RepID=A0A316C339_PSESE|nr:ABC transporter ATP-binding protein [Pseudaminobacter salicylatoxidans]PWJ79735.1 putative spermidine/putrescine transport system ATP-binding protein [Pseudaminobacter salicylatoxidans]